MRAIAVVSQIFLLVFVGAGCESVPAAGEQPSETGNGFGELAIYTDYVPVKVDIMPLSEFVCAGDGETSKIKVYVSLLDSFGCQIKSPGVFRFELYEKVQRSAEPKGGRIGIWPDVDLSSALENNGHWRDFLRAYEFNLDFEPQSNRNYIILQVTFMCPGGERLSDELGLKYTE